MPTSTTQQELASLHALSLAYARAILFRPRNTSNQDLKRSAADLARMRQRITEIKKATL